MKLKRDYTLIRLDNTSVGQWQITWQYKSIFACHKDGSEKRWTITHIPTGMRISYFIGKLSNIRKIFALLELLPVDWQSNNSDKVLSGLYEPRYRGHTIGFIIRTILTGIDLAELEIWLKESSIKDVIKNILDKK